MSAFVVRRNVFEAFSTNGVDPDQTALVGAVSSESTQFDSIIMLTNKQTFSDAVTLLAFQGLNNMFCVCTEVLWRKMIQLHSNKITPHFQLLPMS